MIQQSPVCKAHPNAQRYTNLAMRTMSYDCDRLTIYFQGDDFAFVRVVFENPKGFRVLDEGDLCGFWDDYHTGNGWLYEVQSGGWFELESLRADFLTQYMWADVLVEYLLVCDKCISVLDLGPPTITNLGNPFESNGAPH